MKKKNVTGKRIQKVKPITNGVLVTRQYEFIARGKHFPEIKVEDVCYPNIPTALEGVQSFFLDTFDPERVEQ